MTVFVVVVFAVTYLGMAAGRLPFLSIDRTGIAMVAAVVLVAADALPAAEAVHAVHFPTLLLLGALMIVSGRVEAAGLYAAAAAWIARAADRPRRLLALTLLVGGLLSAVLVNDVVVFAMTPLLCDGLRRRGLDPVPFLIALAAASNAGSAATLIGNPQNILIGQVGQLDFWAYLAVASVPALATLALAYGLIAWLWRDALAQPPAAPETAPVAIDRVAGIACGTGILVLLALFATPLPREMSALLVAALLLLSRSVRSRLLFGQVDLPLLVLFAGLFVVNGALARTGLPADAVTWLAAHGLLPDTAALLAPLTLALSNTIGNVPAVMMILSAWPQMPEPALTALAILSTLAGNLLLVGSLANLIVAERAQAVGVRLGFLDHAKVGVPLTLISMAAAVGWLALLQLSAR